MKIRWILLFCLLPAASGGCGCSASEAEQPPELQSSGLTSIPSDTQLPASPEPSEMPSTPSVEKFVALSRQDLASRPGIEADSIRLVRTEKQLWLNAALGCPRPGMFYPAGRVPGFQIWLEAAGIEYIYNTDFNGTVILCPELNPNVPNLPNDPTPGVPIR